jgi:glycosyltransferase involved in cell wall biosynthesis
MLVAPEEGLCDPDVEDLFDRRLRFARAKNPFRALQVFNALARYGRGRPLFVTFPTFLDLPAVWLVAIVFRSGPVVTVAHDIIPHRRFLPHGLRWIESWLTRACITWPDAVIVHTADGFNQVSAVRGPARSTSFLELPTPMPPRAHPNKLGFVVAGAIRPDKDVVGVLRAYQQLPSALRAENPLHVLGRVDGGTTSRELHELVASDPIGISLDIGHVDRPEFEAALLAARYAILPYVGSISASAVAADALGLGCALLVSDAPGLRYLSARSGCLLWPNTMEDRIQVLTNLCESPPELLTSDGAIESTSWGDFGECAKRLLFGV